MEKIIMLMVVMLLIGAPNVYAFDPQSQFYTAPLSKQPEKDILAGLEHGKAGAEANCEHISGCNDWIMMRGHGFINQTQEFIKGYVYGFCSNPKFTSGGGQEAEQAGFDCDKGPESAFWALPGSLDDNNTTYVTPN